MIIRKVIIYRHHAYVHWGPKKRAQNKIRVMEIDILGRACPCIQTVDRAYEKVLIRIRLSYNEYSYRPPFPTI